MDINAHNSENSLKITYKDAGTLHPYSRNARKHSQKQIRQIANSIESFGFNNPILLDEEDTIIAGHGRWKAAQMLGLKAVPTICLSNMSETQKNAYILADNHLAEKAGWDKQILAIELQNLMEFDLAFDITSTGFEIPEIDLLLDGLKDLDETSEDRIPPVPDKAVTQPGDLWLLGEHRVYCGDSLKEESYSTLMVGQKAHIIFTDPPYNVPIQGHVSGRGKAKHEEFAMASGEMSAMEFITFLRKAFTQMANHSTDGSLHFICMDWRHVAELTEAAKPVYTEFKNLCIWNKDRGGMGALYRSKHELVFLYKNGKASHTNNIQLGKHGRYRTNIWDYPAVNSRETGPTSDLGMHPTVKPTKMIADALMDCSNIGEIVLDPFGGSGSTLMAAERTKRRACLIELSPKYVDVILQRWMRKNSVEPIHEDTGKKFSEIQKERIA